MSVLLVVLTLVQVLMLVLMLVRQLVLVLVLVLVLLLPLLLLRYAACGTRYNCDVVGGRGCHKAELREKRIRGKR